MTKTATTQCSKSAECPVTGCATDVIGKTLKKFGVCRSTLITLALIPFAWDGVIWFRDAIATVWDAVTSWGA